MLLSPGENSPDHASESDDSRSDRDNFSPLRVLDRSQAFVIGSVGGLKRKRKRKLG